MSRTLIVARIQPGTEPEVARIFAASDASPLPAQIGVRERVLYSLGDLYVHVVDLHEDGAQALTRARELPGFRQISRDLTPYISPYLSSWSGPQDAVARPFYRWRAGEA
jgi:cyclase